MRWEELLVRWYPLLQTDDKQTIKRNKPITEDTRCNVENPSKAEQKNHERQPAKLHYIQCGYNAGDLQ